MTVIEFGRKKRKVNTYVVFLISAVVLLVILIVFFYNNLISLRHDVASNQELLNNLQVQTSELKNSLFHITDVSLGDSFAQSSGLILDKNPQYFVSSKELISQATQ